jgi:two-component system, NarL family, sensor kinase
MADYDIKGLVLITTLIFLIAPAFIISYIFVYNRRKKKHIEEKAQMQLKFEAEIAKAQLEVQEQTMQTIGADLHDNIGQLLSLTSLTLNSIELDNQAKAQKKIDASIDLVLRSIKEMRLLGKLLQGDQLVAMGLPEAIRQEINWMERSGKYEVQYEQASDIPMIKNVDKDLIIFRILQEVLNNIIKHAFASQINIKLEYIDQRLKLQIADNGVGFAKNSLSAEQSGMGLLNIQKRAGIVGGEANIVSNPGTGTNITVFIPYP